MTEKDFGIKPGQTAHQEGVATMLSSVVMFMRRLDCCEACIAKLEQARDEIAAPTSTT